MMMQAIFYTVDCRNGFISFEHGHKLLNVQYICFSSSAKTMTVTRYLYQVIYYCLALLGLTIGDIYAK